MLSGMGSGSGSGSFPRAGISWVSDCGPVEFEPSGVVTVGGVLDASVFGGGVCSFGSAASATWVSESDSEACCGSDACFAIED